MLLDRQRIDSGAARAIIVNSGNANCCNGDRGIRDAELMAELTAAELGIAPDEVLVASTGVIGAPMPMERIRAAIPGLAQSLVPEGFSDLALAMMTTDTVPKLVSQTGRFNGKVFHLTAAAKGAGMIRRTWPPCCASSAPISTPTPTICPTPSTTPANAPSIESPSTATPAPTTPPSSWPTESPARPLKIQCTRPSSSGSWTTCF